MKEHNFNLFSEIVVDNFAGGGGASTGIEMALGRSPEIAINHDPDAIAMHTVNHPSTEHHCESVWDIVPSDVVAGRPVGLVWLSPDCFPAGTMILTDRGYRPIESIKEGDRVLTHAGRYRRVYATMRSVKPVRNINIQGVPRIVTSDEHPFFARTMHNIWNNEKRRYERHLLPAAWVAAKDLRAGAAPMNAAGGDRHFCATPCSFDSLPIPPVGGRGINIDEKLMWLAGRYVGDGWSRIGGGRAELVIICGKKESDELAEKLDLWPRLGARADANELAWYRRETKTSCQFSTNHRGLVEWLRNEFGHGGGEKSFPAWCMSAPEPLRRALLAGYVSADGCDVDTGANQITETNTISKALALSTKAIVESLGFTATVSQPRSNSTVIEGRTVNSKPSYLVRWREHPLRVQTVREGIHNWSRVQSVSSQRDAIEVFNISVEEDETYIADGIVVHNCKHFSKAKGSTPVSKKIRGLAWVALRWAAQVRPRVIMLENVEEFQTWGPLLIDSEGNARPDPAKKGRTFNSFINALRRQGYKVEWRELRACDYGTPTIRKRLFLIARRDGAPIVWPKPTHGAPDSAEVKAGKLQPWHTAADIIDWSIPCASIFERKRPLAENTLRRIAKGLERFVINAAEPFIVPVDRGSALAPFITECANASHQRNMPADEPLRTICAQVKGGHFALVSPVIARQFGRSVGQSVEEPLGTVMAKADKSQLVTAFLAKHYTGVVGAELTKPLPTVTTVDHNALVTSHLVKLRGTCQHGQPVTEPMPTVTAGGLHIGEVRAFLLKYYGTNIGHAADEPLQTVTTKHRFGLVTVCGENYQIVDIGMRMLEPHELFAAQGFPADYVIDHDATGKKFTKTAQVARCGNAVCPPLAAALVRANVPEMCTDAQEVAA